MAVSRDEALELLQKLGVSDGREQLARRPLQYINAIIKGFTEHIPFQTVSLMGTSKEERSVPSLEEVVARGLSLEGGLCFTINAFMCLLLRGLGLHTQILQGTHLVSNNPNTHPVVLLKDLRYPGDAHIIDVGGGYPLQEAVALQDLPAEYCHAGHQYRFQRDGDKVDILFYIKKDRESKGEAAKGDWCTMFEFNLMPVEFDAFPEYLEVEYLKDDARFLNSLRAVRYSGCKEAGEQTMVAVVNYSLLVGPGDDAEKTKVSAADLPGIIKQHFPNIPHDKVDLAVKRLLTLDV